MALSTRFNYANPSGSLLTGVSAGSESKFQEVLPVIKSGSTVLPKPVSGLLNDNTIANGGLVTRRQPPSPNAKTAAILQANDRGQTVISEKQKNGMIGAGVLVAVLFFLDLF